VIIDGRLQERRWETEDGQKRSKYEVVAQSVQFLPKKEGGGAGGEGLVDEMVDNNDVPF
jgi:single-strand DNA-binding protein